jgi:hypothetical protein
MPTEGLSEDPRIERLEVWRELAKTKARWRFLVAVVALVGFTAAQLFVAAVFAVGVALTALVGSVYFDRWRSAADGDEQLEQNLRALTTIYHESPRTIRKWLTAEFIDDSVRNLLAAALDSEDLANGYWKQGVEPFLRESTRGFKATWSYQIDLVDLKEDKPLLLEGNEVARIRHDTHRRLHTTVTYMQRIPNPSEMYYVAAVFDGADLPEWFKRPNFLLREVVVMPEELIASLPTGAKAVEQLPLRLDEDAAAMHAAQGAEAELARAVLKAGVVIGEKVLEPVSLHMDKSGISWGFQLSEELQAGLSKTSQIRVELETFMSRRQRHFPVVIATPTRNPTIQFNYALTDIQSVETEVFFSAERPWDARLRNRHTDYRRIDVLTEPDDWVFAGSGCMFAWWDERATTTG